MVPVFNVVAFCFSAQYIVPEMARGFCLINWRTAENVMVGMLLTFVCWRWVLLGVIALSGLDNISDVATIFTGTCARRVGLLLGKPFALCAMLKPLLGGRSLAWPMIIDRISL